MKKLIIIALLLFMALGLAACEYEISNDRFERLDYSGSVNGYVYAYYVDIYTEVIYFGKGNAGFCPLLHADGTPYTKSEFEAEMKE